VTAEFVANALNGHRAGTGWVVHCPAHDDRTPSLSVRDTKDGKVLVRCHAGCEQTRVIEVLRSRGLWTARRPRSVVAPQAAVPRLASNGGQIRTTRGARKPLWRYGGRRLRRLGRRSRPISYRAVYVFRLLRRCASTAG
jgi:hypothetical protein